MMNTKEKIIHHALCIFDEKGYHGTSVRDIMKKVDRKETALYHHFGSKDGLYEYITCDLYEEIVSRIEAESFQKVDPQLRTLNEIADQIESKDQFILYIRQYLVDKTMLQGDELLVHRLVVKNWLGLEGSLSMQKRLLEFRNTRMATAYKAMIKVIDDSERAGYICNWVIDLMVRIILKITVYTEQDIFAQINHFFV